MEELTKALWTLDLLLVPQGAFLAFAIIASLCNDISTTAFWARVKQFARFISDKIRGGVHHE